jgi:stress response protein SCP2
MAVSLKKGQGISLKKNEYDLSSVTIGLGWDIREEKKGFLSGIFSKKEEDYDLDTIAFLCLADGKIENVGRNSSGNITLVGGDVIFYNNKKHGSENIWLTGDNRTGVGDGDDEQIIVNLNELFDKYAKVVFIVQIYNGQKNGQSFGKIDNAFIRAVDGRGVEMLRFDLSGGIHYENCHSMLFSELIREPDGWKFTAIGEPSSSDSIMEWVNRYS